MKLVVAAAPNVGPEVRESYLKAYGEALAPLPPWDDASIIVVLTGGAEEEILSNAGRYNVLVAWPQYNSLPSALEAAAALRERGAFAYIIQVKSPEEDPPVSKIKKILGVISLFKTPPKLGLVGMPNSWLVASTLRYPAVEIDEEAVYRKSLAINATRDAEEFASRATNSAYRPQELERIFAYARALEEAASGLEGITLGCWCFNFGAVRDRGWTPCLSLAVLNDRGIAATCEGDLRALYSAVVLRRISGKPTWISNVNYIGDDMMVLTHDGMPPSMAESFEIVPRLATKAPAAMRASPPPDMPITLLRVSGDLRKAVVIRGRTARAPRVEACASQVGVRAKNPRVVLEAGLGNHLAYVLDDVYDEVLAYLKHLGAEILGSE